MTVEARMLWTLSLFFFLIGALYWATAHEAAGVTLLMLCSGAAILAVLPYHIRRRRERGEHVEHHLPPTSSLWPFIIGAGAVLVVDGFILGPWLLVPGAALVLRGLVGIFGRPPEAEPPAGSPTP